ncbi:sorting nexin-21 [Erythrolamprus reginae]|uniref:sorting nexin-21 n=1 Tax=Erythrolamprus reginae TaxID=121349 RepID=UPI00396CA4B7
MAARLLHRLRQALSGAGASEGASGGCAGPEDCPESSELDDDTEGLATRLSGTLSFSSNEEDGAGGDEEEEEDESGGCQRGTLLELHLPADAPEVAEPVPPLAEQRGGHLLTRQLQEFWRKSRGSFVPQRLLFEVTSASVVSERNSKHVLYTIYLIRAGQFDQTPATVARSYSDFERLNRVLRRRFGREMAGVPFPRKQLWRNFTPATIAKRSRAFEQFLSRLYASAEIRRSAAFLEFFYLDSLQGALGLTGRGLYPQALAAWMTARRLQEKLGACRSGHFLLTLAGLTVCHQELEQWAEAQEACQEALHQLEGQAGHLLRAALLQSHAHLAWVLGKDKWQAESRLRGLRESGEGQEPPATLKELLLEQRLP